MRFLHQIFLILFVGSATFLHSQTYVFTPKSIEDHIKYLASDELTGRYPGTHGDKMAAEYIRNHFAKLGLKLAFSEGFQAFEVVTGVELLRGNFIEVNGEPALLEKDFIPLSFSKSSSAEAEVVFAGYGIVMDGSWNDYESLSVNGKWVLALCGDPEPENSQSAFIPFSSDRLKAIAAKDRGAAGLLLVKGVNSEKDDKLMPSFYDKIAADAGIPVLNITRGLANKIIQNQNYTIESIEKKIQSDKKPHGFATGTNFKGNISLGYRNVGTQNVVAILQGSDPVLKDEYIMIGAHYDHLGMGGTGSGSRMPDTLAVHYGADDNASGVAGVLELASSLQANSGKIKRSVIFIAFGAEEMGLIGAKHFAAHSPVPIDQIKAMINLDMIGRMKKGGALAIGGTGTAPQIDEMLNHIEGKYSFAISRQPDGYGPSDHASFYAAGIPVLFFSTGAHEDYHTPGDTWDKLNTEGQVAVQQLVFDVANYIANHSQAFTFTESGTVVRRGQGRGYKVTLGIVPDVASSRNGLGVDGVRKDGPAARAGILKGDLIVAMNGLPVGNIYEYMARLNSLTAGETVSVELNRNGKREIVLVQL
ncbi:MAG: M20/M25/M40 family metallo-hydrolase [Bacteroidales bacterium]|nr:M20/M25/M40 family metallo-hydrolase [Bacteroidales bacterium]MDZ4203962.1 M20/M25/M40 family metallo-hydrolase [Bacteroidales bacterium]